MRERTRILFLASAIAVVVVGSALSAGCSGTAPSPSSTTPPAVTPVTPPPSTPSTPPVSGIDLGKLIFQTGTDNAGVIPTKGGIAKITVNACKNCHGANAKGGKPLPGPDIRGSKLQPDFNEAKFVTAVTTGIDDAGKPLHKQMPRFSATPEDTAALWQYLNSLK